MAISRAREFEAEHGAELSRDPDALAKIDAYARGIPMASAEHILKRRR